MKKLFFIFIFTLLFSALSLGQAIIEGTVKDMETGKPLPGVNVYLSGTTFGTATDNNGHYKFTSSAAGFYNLVFSFVGYQKEVRQIELKSTSAITININMEEKVNELESIEVTASNKQWQRHYNIFFNQFIGKTEYADEVTIENPWVLDFKEDDGSIIAISMKPLIITNMALGYKLHVELVKFKWPKYQDRGGAYVFYSSYEQIEPEGKKQQHRWKKNRIKSYAGSFDHFLKTLYSDKLDGSNFSINRSWNLSHLPNGKTRYELNFKPDIHYTLRATAKGFELDGKIDVKYDGAVRYEFNGTTHSVYVDKRGGIVSKTRDHFFFVDRYGTLLDPTSIELSQNWATSRMANNVPTNYSIGD